MYTVKINTASALQVEIGTAMHSTQIILRLLNGLEWKYKGLDGVLNRLEKLGGFRENGVSEKIDVCGFPMPIKFPGTPTYKKTREEWQKKHRVAVKGKRVCEGVINRLLYVCSATTARGARMERLLCRNTGGVDMYKVYFKGVVPKCVELETLEEAIFSKLLKQKWEYKEWDSAVSRVKDIIGQAEVFQAKPLKIKVGKREMRYPARLPWKWKTSKLYVATYFGVRLKTSNVAEISIRELYPNPLVIPAWTFGCSIVIECVE